jgi:hypothetical protein
LTEYTPLRRVCVTGTSSSAGLPGTASANPAPGITRAAASTITTRDSLASTGSEKVSMIWAGDTTTEAFAAGIELLSEACASAGGAQAASKAHAMSAATAVPRAIHRPTESAMRHSR